MLLYSMAQEHSQKCPISFACDLSIEAAVASQRGRTKTSKTGSGCPPCRCCAPSNTCSSCWPPGRTCSLLAEVHIHSHDRLAPAVLQMCTLNLVITNSPSFSKHIFLLLQKLCQAMQEQKNKKLTTSDLFPHE